MLRGKKSETGRYAATALQHACFLLLLLVRLALPFALSFPARRGLVIRLVDGGDGRSGDGSSGSVGGSGSSDDVNPVSSVDPTRNSLERLFQESGARLPQDMPQDSEQGAQEAAASIEEALARGQMGLIVDVNVAELDEDGRGYDLASVCRFVGGLAQGLPGPVKVLMRTLEAATAANDQLQLGAVTRGAGGIAALSRVAFGCYQDSSGSSSGRSGSGSVDARLDVAGRAAAVAEHVSADDASFVVVGPKGAGDIMALRAVLEAAAGRPVLVLNPRLRQPPRELLDFELVYDLQPFKVIPARRNPRARFNPLSVDRSASRINSDATVDFLPRVVLFRRFPGAWRLFVDADGGGYKEESSFERRPSMPRVMAIAQRVIDKTQRALKASARELSLKAKMKEEAEEEQGRGNEDRSSSADGSQGEGS